MSTCNVLCEYLRGMQQFVVIRGSKYAYKSAKQADLQGGVLYHILFEL